MFCRETLPSDRHCLSNSQRLHSRRNGLYRGGSCKHHSLIGFVHMVTGHTSRYLYRHLYFGDAGYVFISDTYSSLKLECLGMVSIWNSQRGFSGGYLLPDPYLWGSEHGSSADRNGAYEDQQPAVCL